MPEKTKLKEVINREDEKKGKKTFTDEKGVEKDVLSWDQKEKSYYYDDSHGYEIYNPDEDEEDE